MATTFNEFNRLMQRLEIPENQQKIFAELFVRFGDVLKQQEETGKLMIAFANQLKGFVELNEVMQKKMLRLSKGQKLDGVDVASESFTNDPKKSN